MRLFMSLWLCAAFFCATAFLPSLATAEADRSVPHIGYLVLSALGDSPSPERAGFLQGLKELGYEDGKNIIIEYRSAAGDPSVMPFLIHDLVDLKVKAVVTVGSPSIRAVREVSQTIPVVMMGGADPVRLGFVKSLARPGTNVTGMTAIQTELGPKRLQILTTAFPKIAHIAVVIDKTNQGIQPEMSAVEAAAKELGIRVSIVGLPDVQDDQSIRRQLDAAHPDAIMTIIDPRVSAYRTFLPQYANERGIPAMFDWGPFVDAGGLMSYSPDFSDMARRSALFVDKIINGALPADLPVEQPTQVQLFVNLKTAKMLKFQLPGDVLLRADKVVE